MNKGSRMALAALGLVCAAVMAGEMLPASGKGQGSAGELRDELRDAQLLTLPVSSGVSTVDGGEFLFDPAPEDPLAMLLLLSLVPEPGSLLGLPVTLFEDSHSRETVFLNAAGAEALRLPPELGYVPEWVFAMLYPVDGVLDPAAYDPSRVALRLRLLVAPGWEGLLGTGGEVGGGSAATAGSIGGQPAFAPGQSVSAGVTSTGVTGSESGQEASGYAAAAGAQGNNISNSVSMASGRRMTGYAAHTFYVDRGRGCDAWSGRSELPPPDLSSPEGPKRTIHAGLSSGGRKGTVVIKGGVYSEGISVRGGREDVIIRGHVRLAREYEDSEAAAAAFASRRRDAPPASSNMVTRVSQ